MRRSMRTLSSAATLLAAAGLGGCGTIASHLTTAPPTNMSADANRPSLIAARSALAEGQAATALGIAHGVLVGDPNNVAALVSAGDADNQIGNRRVAQREYEHALQVNPGYVPARLGLGKLKMRDDIKGAEADFRAVLASAPQNAAAMTDLGVTLDLQGRHKEAQAMYTASLLANPDLTSTRVDFGLSLALTGNADKAEAMLRDATESGPVPPKVRADFAVAEVVAGHPEQAQATLEADLSVDEAKASVKALSVLAPSSAAATAPVAAATTAPVSAAPLAAAAATTSAVAATPAKTATHN
jgi:Flp pilus assembly protein TadD